MKKKILTVFFAVLMLVSATPLFGLYTGDLIENDINECYADALDCELELGAEAKIFYAGARIKGVSVWRQNSTTATIRFSADTTGTCYYVISENPNAPVDIASVGTVGAEVTGNTTAVINLSGLTSGPKYAHVILKTASGFVSNVLSVAMPYDLYFFDDFESYAIDTYPSSFSLRYNGSGDANQKIIVDAMGNNSYNRCFRLQAAYSWASEQKIDLPADLQGVIVMELDAKAVAGVWPLSMEFASNTGTWGTRIARMSMDSGSFGYGTGAGYFVSSGISYNSNQWYRIKIVLDIDARKFDYFADGTKLNAEPVTASGEALNFFSLVAGNTGSGCEGYFDNVTVYLTSHTEISINTQPSQFTSVNKGCITGSLLCSASTSDGSPLTYRWYSCSDADKNGESEIQGATDARFQIPAELSEGDYYYFCRIFAGDNTCIDTDVSCVRVLLTHTVTATAGQGGTISPGGESVLPDGEDLTYTITPDTGYHISCVYVDGENMGAIAEYTFENVYGDRSIEACFEDHCYINWVSNNDNTHTGTCSCNETITESCTPGEWLIDRPSTFFLTGLRHKKCTACNAVLEESEMPVISASAGEIVLKGNKGLFVLNTSGCTVSKLIALFDSPNISVFKDNTELNDNDIVSTSCEIRLFNGYTVIDTLYVIIKGDVDCNGIVDVTDARTALRAAVELEKLNELALYAADTLGDDGKVTIEDARCILRVSVGLEVLS